MLKYCIFLCLLIANVFTLPLEEEVTAETSPDTYEHRVKLLTGGTSVKACDQKNEDLGECLRRIFTDMLPRVVDGIPEINLPAIDPLKVNRTTFQFALGIATGRLMVKSAEIHGISKSVLQSIKFKVENGNTKFWMSMLVPKMNIVGEYKAELKLNNQLNLKPKGMFNLSLSDVDIIATMDGKLFERDGHKFIRLHNIDAAPTIGDLDIDVSGIFREPELNELAMNVAKQYWREIYRVMLPETRSYWAPLVLRLMNEGLGLIPFDAFVKAE